VNQKLIATVLHKQGHNVVLAQNGNEALAAVERQSFDVIQMDVQMPHKDGLEAAVAIRERRSELRAQARMCRSWH